MAKRPNGRSLPSRPTARCLPQSVGRPATPNFKMYRSSRGETKAALVSALVIAASAGAFFLSTGLGVVWPLAWLAPLPVLLLAFRRSWRESALVAFIAYFLGSFTILGLFRAGGSAACRRGWRHVLEPRLLADRFSAAAADRVGHGP